MKHRKIICTILSLLVFAMLIPAADMEVSAEERSIPVSMTFTEDMEYRMEVTVESGGKLMDGIKPIAPGATNGYDISLGNRKYFKIVPDEGYELASLSYTRPDIDPNVSISIMDRVKNGEFYLDVESTRIVLTATFKKIESGTGDGSGGTGGGSGDTGSESDGTGSNTGTSGGTDKPSSGSSGTGTGGTSQSVSLSGTSAKTGDPSTAEWYLAIMLLAAAAMTIIAAKKRKIVYKGSE